MQLFGWAKKTPRQARSTTRSLAFLLSLLLAQFALAAEAWATNWVVNINDTGYDPIPLGGTIQYSITVENEDLASNTAPQNALNLSIPAGFTFTGGTGTITGCAPVPAAGATTVSCTVPPLAGGDIATLTASVRTSTQGTFTVDAQVPTLGVDSEPANNVGSQATTVIDGTDLSLAVTGPATAASGSSASYTFTATNGGPLSASGVVVTIPVPAGLFAISVPPNCSLSGSNYLCTIAGPLAPGASASVTLQGQVGVAATSSIAVLGSITSSTPPDAIPANDSASTSTTVTSGSDVKISKSRSPSGALLVGNAVTFTLNGSYTGESPTGLTVVDEVPGTYQIDAVTPAAGSGWTCTVASQTVTCTRPSGDAAGFNVSLGAITIDTTVISAGSPTNTATISSDGPPDPRPGNNTATDGGASISDQSADLRANKDGPANPPNVLEGQPFSFTISTKNLGNKPFAGTVVMTDSLPAGLQVTGYTLRGWSCSPATPITGPADIICRRDYTDASPLAVGATTPSVTLTTVSTVSGSVSLTNSMTVTTENPNFPDPNLANNTASYGVNSTPAGTSADIKVIKTALNKTIASGDLETFDIEVVNLGGASSSSVTLTDDFNNLINNKTGSSNGLVQAVWTPNLASGMTCSLTGLGGATGTRGRLSCSIATLPVCSTGVDCPKVSVTVRPGGDAGNRTNSASATSSVTFDPDQGNNTGSDSYDVTARADVTVSKSVSPPSPVAGQSFTYVIAAATTADGRSAAENVTVTDTLPSGLIFVSATPKPDGSCSTAPAARAITGTGQNLVVCNLGTIGSGVQKTVEVTVAASTEIRGTTIRNTAHVDSSTPGNDPANDDAFVDALIQPPSLDLQVNKADTPSPLGPDPVGIGSNMSYRLTVRNNGPSAAETVTVTDTMPDNFLSFVSFTAPADVNCTTVPAAGAFGGTLQCVLQTPLFSGESRIIDVTMKGEARGVATNRVTVSSVETTLGFDSNMANNQDAETTTVRTRADVEVVSKSPSKSPVSLGESFTFQILVRNNAGPGLSEADTVVVSDTLPAGMKLTAVPSAVVGTGTATSNICSGTSGGGSFSCEFGTMSAGAEVTITAPVVVSESGGTQQDFTNTASVATTSIEADPANNSNSGQVSVEAASLAGQVFADFNDDGTRDPGDQGLGGIAITLSGTGPGGAPVTLTVTTAADGSYVFPAVPPGTYTLTRGAVSDPGFSDGRAIPGTAGGSASGAVAIGAVPLTARTVATGYEFTVVPEAGIAITKALLSGPTANADGSFEVSFRLTVSNPSQETLQDITVTDQLAGAAPLFGTYAASPSSPGTYSVSAPPGGSCGGLNAAFNGSSSSAVAQGGSLAANASCAVDFTLRVMPTSPLPPLVNGGRYINQATVIGSGGQSGTPVTSLSDPVPISPTLPQLALAKVMTGYSDADGSKSVTFADVLDFRITATNTGSVDLTSVTVSDTRLTPSSTTCSTVAPGQTCVLTGIYTVTTDDVQAGSVVNTATADSDETDPVTASATTPVVAAIGKNTLTKTALVNTAKRGEKVPYVIVAERVPFNPARLIDVMPPGFSYIEGSAIANGAKVNPASDGRRLTFDALAPDAEGNIKLELTLVAGASVNPGVAVNQSQLVDPDTGKTIATAKARVTILAEAVFDCGDVIGKVFDDKNRSGYQDEGEPGLPAVRVATVNGLLVTSDAEGRFNIPCADIPDADIGSNFVLKLDTRTLPTGYHLTTENPRRVRLTRGKVVKLNFGASISRLVRLELNGEVFTPGSAALLPRWEAGLDKLIAALKAETSVLEITYRGSDDALARARLRRVRDEVVKRWGAVPGRYDLAIDTRIVSGGAQ